VNDRGLFRAFGIPKPGEKEPPVVAPSAVIVRREVPQDLGRPEGDLAASFGSVKCLGDVPVLFRP
jgi:hypothetical protein